MCRGKYPDATIIPNHMQGTPPVVFLTHILTLTLTLISIVFCEENTDDHGSKEENHTRRDEDSLCAGEISEIQLRCGSGG